MVSKNGAMYMQQVYLDNAATTPLHPEVKDAVIEAMDLYANPSSLHRIGADAEKLVTSSRKEVAGLLNVSSGNLVFTSGGTEANNLAIKGLLARTGRKGRIITSAIEHPSVMEVMKSLDGQGWDVVTLPVDGRGRVVISAFEEALTQPTVLVSIMAVNNETGAVQPLEQIAKLVREKQPQALIHVDAVQAPGKLDFNPSRIGLDMVAVSAHKIHGPKGIGALYVARRDLLSPLLNGGGQEGALRSGTENVMGIAGFGRAAALARKHSQLWLSRVTDLRRQFTSGLVDVCCTIISPEDGAPHIIAVSFPGFRGEVLLQALSGYGVYVSTGAACSGKKGNMSHVAQALGLDEETSSGLLRFSFSALNTSEEIDFALAKIKQVLAELAFVRGRRSK
jgi:cysteine desulfurase